MLPAAEGLRLVSQTPGAECLLIAADGRQFRSNGWKALEVARPPARTAAPVGPASRRSPAAAANPWPAGYQTTITITLLPQNVGARYRRPYVAVWIEDAAGKPVRTLACWGPQAKYQKDLTAWWKFAVNDPALVKAVTRATRPPGRYQLVWDGLDDKGNPVEQGTYMVQVEVHREHGKHVRQTGAIECRAAKATATLGKTAENDDTLVEYAPKGK